MFVCASEFVRVFARACMYMRLRDISLARIPVRARIHVHTLMRVLQKTRGNEKKNYAIFFCNKARPGTHLDPCAGLTHWILKTLTRPRPLRL